MSSDCRVLMLHPAPLFAEPSSSSYLLVISRKSELLHKRSPFLLAPWFAHLGHSLFLGIAPVSRNENAETPDARNEKAAGSKDKDAKAKAKGKAAGKGKDKDNTPAKGKAAKGEGEERHDS